MFLAPLVVKYSAAHACTDLALHSRAKHCARADVTQRCMPGRLSSTCLPDCTKHLLALGSQLLRRRQCPDQNLPPDGPTTLARGSKVVSLKEIG
eukprot:3538627-Pleurochrysis_carterae.AAC.1